MPNVLRRLNLSPRALALAGAALVVFLIWRRGSGGDGGGLIEGPLTSIPGGTEEFPNESTVPITIPLPPGGGIIHIPGEDPILIEPPPPAAAPAPVQPPAKAPRWIRRFGRYWRPGQLNAFRAEWARRQRRKRQGAGGLAWQTYLRRNPSVARFFGLAATIPNPRTTPQVAAVPSQARPDQRLALKPGIVQRGPFTYAKVGGLVSRKATAAMPREQSTISGARVILPRRPLRGPRSPRRQLRSGPRR